MVPRAERLFLFGCVLALAGLGLGTAATWSPYFAGALIGVLSWLSLYLVDKPIGTSTTDVRVSGMLARLFSPRSVAENDYMQATGIRAEWQMLVVLGVLLGGPVSAPAAGTFGLRWVPDVLVSAFGAAIWPRLLVVPIGASWWALEPAGQTAAQAATVSQALCTWPSRGGSARSASSWAVPSP